MDNFEDPDQQKLLATSQINYLLKYLLLRTPYDKCF